MERNWRHFYSLHIDVKRRKLDTLLLLCFLWCLALSPPVRTEQTRNEEWNCAQVRYRSAYLDDWRRGSDVVWSATRDVTLLQSRHVLSTNIQTRYQYTDYRVCSLHTCHLPYIQPLWQRVTATTVQCVDHRGQGHLHSNTNCSKFSVIKVSFFGRFNDLRVNLRPTGLLYTTEP